MSIIYTPHNIAIEEIQTINNPLSGFKTTKVATKDIKPEKISYSNLLGIINNPIEGNIEFKGNTKVTSTSQGLLDLMKKHGINVRVTSGIREGAKTKQGKTSWHATDTGAMDITPVEGESFEELISKITSNSEITKYMEDNKLGILDEIGSKWSSITGSTGDHLHIGPDTIALNRFNELMKKVISAQNGVKMPTKKHTIKKGDTFSKLSKLMNINSDVLEYFNPKVNPSKLQIDQEINVPDTTTPDWKNKVYLKGFYQPSVKDNFELFTPSNPKIDWSYKIPELEERASKQLGKDWPKLQRFLKEYDKAEYVDMLMLVASESGFDPKAKSKWSSASGLGQFLQSTALDMFGEEAALEYKNGTRSVDNQIKDLDKMWRWIDGRVTKERGKHLTYGRYKINLLSPNAGLDDNIPDSVWNESLSDSAKTYLYDKHGKKVKYRDLMTYYNETRNN